MHTCVHPNSSMGNSHINSGLSQDDSHSACISAHELQYKQDTNIATLPHQFISPEFAFHLLLSVVFGVVALTTQRFKVLWVPHMCVLAAGAVANLGGWRAILKRIGAVKSNHSVSYNRIIK